MPASKTIEARLVIAAEGGDRSSAEIAKVVKAMKEADKAVQFSDKVDRLAKSLEGAQRQAKAMGDVMSARGPLEATVKGLANAQRETDRLARAYDTARKAHDDFAKGQRFAKGTEQAQQAARLAAEVKRVGDAHRASERDVTRLNAAFQAQTSTLRSAEAAASKLGADLSNLERHQQGVARQTDLATRALRAQITAEEAGEKAAAARAHRSARRREAVGTLASGAGVLAAHEGKRIGLDAIKSAASFDIAVRKQKVYSDISEADQAMLRKQATRIGQETQFSNIDVVHAQTAAMQGLPASFAPTLKAEIAEGIIDNVRNFSTLMDTDLAKGSEIIRGYLQQTGKDIGTKEKALHEANKATNQLVKMAKLGGMDGSDVELFAKYAASPGTAAGISTESLMSLGALARRGGLRGDEAGVFIRSAASHLVSPTNKGHMALAAAGMRHSDYVSMPDKLSTGALESAFRLKIGKEFTPEIRRQLDAINSDKDLLGDQGRYTAAVVRATGGILGKDKKGRVRASDAKTAAKAAGDFYRMSAGNVDVERLLDDAMSRNMTLAQLNALLTDKHGGKGAITQRQWDEFKVARGEIKKAGDDPNYAKTRADYVFAGVGGSVENLKGSFENLVLQIGEANAGLIKWTADLAGNGLDLFSKLPKGQQQMLSLGGGAAAMGSGAVGALVLTSKLLGLGGGGAALNGSAAALTKSAALLDAAAMKLAGGVPGGVDPKDAVKAAPLAALGLAGVTLGTVAGAAFAGYATAKVLPKVAEKEGMGAIDPGTGEKIETEIPQTTPWLRNWLTGKPAEEAGKAAGVEVGKGLVSVPLPPPRPDAFRPITEKAGEAGTEAGRKTGQGVADGVQEKAPEVEAQGKTLWQRLKDTMANPIYVPISFVPGEGGGGGGGGGLIQRASFGGGSGGGFGGGAGGFVRRASLGGGDGPPPGAGGSDRITGPLAKAPTEGLRGDVRAYVRAAAIARGIDPNVAERVVNQESGFNPHRNNITSKEHSYGVMQLNTMGGLGAVALRKGLDPRDPSQWRKHIDFGLDVVKRDGWRQWYGARDVGISRWQGIGRNGLEVPDAPAGGFGGGAGARGIGAHVAEFGKHVDRLADMNFHGRVDVALSGGGGRVTGMRAKGRGMSADMGVSMPGAKESDDDWS